MAEKDRYQATPKYRSKSGSLMNLIDFINEFDDFH